MLRNLASEPRVVHVQQRILASRFARELRKKVPRDHRETDAAFHHRRRVVTGVSVVGAGLLGTSLSTKPGSKEFYVLTLAVASTWFAGAVASGPLHLGYEENDSEALRRPFVTPVITGVAAFGFFYGCALVCRRVPILNTAIMNVLEFADHGSPPLVVSTTFANGAAEEVFFRGALYAAVGTQQPVAKSTAIYALATTTTRNPALVLASAFMGTIFALQRRSTGGIQAPLLTHLTWSALMLRFMPPLFRSEKHGKVVSDDTRQGVALP